MVRFSHALRLALAVVTLWQMQGALGIGRTLFQEDTVSYVTTAEELLAAVERGDPHIEVVRHLDFSGIPSTPVGTEYNNSGTINVLGKGNCDEAMPTLAEVSLSTSGPELWPQKPGQCLLSGFEGAGIFVTGEEEGYQIWIDNLYLREGDNKENLGILLALGKLKRTSTIDQTVTGYITRTTVQGNSEAEIFGVAADGRTYMEDVLVSHMPPVAVPLYVSTEGAAVTLQNCEFSEFPGRDDRSYVILGDILGQGSHSGLRLLNTTYPSSTTAHVSAYNETEVYGDNNERVFRRYNDGERPEGNGEYEIAKDPSEAASSTLQFIAATDGADLIAEAEAARERSPPRAAPGESLPVSAPGPGSSDTESETRSTSVVGNQGEGEGGLSTGAVSGIAVSAAIALLAVAALVAVLFLRRNRGNSKDRDAPKGPVTDAATISTVGYTGGNRSSEPTGGALSTVSETWQSQSQFGAPPSMHGGHGMYGTPSMYSTPSIMGGAPDRTDVSSCYGAPSLGMHGSSIPQTPSIMQSTPSIMQHTPSMPVPPMHPAMHPGQPGVGGMNGHVCQALEFMHAGQHALVGRYDLLGASDRSVGSFGVVQAATVARLPDVVAIKMFTDAAGFANEQRAYGIKEVADAVGTVPTFMANEDRAAVMPSGWPFPPFTVAEKGQPLDVWMRSFSADPITSMQVLGQVLKSVKAVHGAGYAHRNIKPSNILQREKQHDWMLFDFSASCPVGAVAPLPSNASSLAYTAPEVLASIGLSNPPSAPASTEADMWALGIVAFELLTNERVFAPGTPTEAIRAAICGQVPLPWEDGAAGAEERREKLRGLRRLVMPCLSRDPAQRPSAATVLHSWHNMFDDMKTRGTFESDGAQKGESTRGDATE